MKLYCSLLFSLTLVACGGTGGTTGSGGGSTSASSSASGGPALSPEMQMAKFCADTTAPFCQALFACCDYVDGEFCRITGGVGQCAPVGKVGDTVCDLNTDPGFTCDSATCDVSLQCISPTPDRLCKTL